MTGWKDIANHLGKGVRTVQRWEKVYGLPVHRLGEDGGEIVYAFTSEIAEWLKTLDRGSAVDPVARPAGAGGSLESPPPPVPLPDGQGTDAPIDGHGDLPIRPAPPAGRTSGLVVVAAVALLGLVSTGLAWLALTRGPVRSGVTAPADAARVPGWRVESDRLIVLDAEGRPTWSHELDLTTEPDWPGLPKPGWSGPIAITDLDGDGTREVLLSVPRGWPRGRRLVCLNADGTTRWTREPDDRQRFGDEWYAAPWISADFRVSPRPDGTSVVWATFHHHLLFPSVLEQLAPDGRVLSRYWSNGYVDSLSEATWQGREVLLVGAANNEHKGASLAILDRADASGNAPAENPKYRCATCPGRDPLGFVVFPPTPVGRVHGETSSVRQAWVDADGKVLVASNDPAPGFGEPGTIFFTLDERLRPRRVEVAASYSRLHDGLFRANRIGRPYTPAEERLIVPLLRWDGVRFVEAPLVR